MKSVHETITALIIYEQLLQTFTFQDEVGKMVLNICEVKLCFVTVFFVMLLQDTFSGSRSPISKVKIDSPIVHLPCNEYCKAV